MKRFFVYVIFAATLILVGQEYSHAEKITDTGSGMIVSPDFGQDGIKDMFSIGARFYDIETKETSVNLRETMRPGERKKIGVVFVNKLDT